MAKPERQIRRCAVYTRKSSEDGLEQEFNSLHAQREACEAFVRSQAGEGWTLIATAYDDGGISGGTMDRPGLKGLMADIAMGVIDTVVVYKVDRLTRSLSDFAKLVELFDRHNVTFVAVTQQFNTTTSMGRLTLNILLSFAQFEREVIGERVRDKIAASKRKGMWMGGLTPLGYERSGRTLVINPEEAETIRTIFGLYNQLNSVQRLKHELGQRGIVSKRRILEDGNLFGGVPISSGNLYAMLRNPLYIGQIRHKSVCHSGLHQPIIDQALWDETQARLERNRQGTKERQLLRNPAALADKLFDDAGDRLVPTHAQKQGRRYRYYISHYLTARDPCDTRKGWRLPAPAFEKMVVAATDRLFDDQALLASAWREAGLPFERFSDTVATIGRRSAQDTVRLIERVEIASVGLTLTICLASLVPDGPTLKHHVPIKMRRRGVEMRVVLDNGPGNIDPVLLLAVAKGRMWFDQLTSGAVANLSEIAKRNGISSGRVSQLVKLAMLSPKIVQAIVEGRQPADLTVKTFSRLETIPVSWVEQEALLGF